MEHPDNPGPFCHLESGDTLDLGFCNSLRRESRTGGNTNNNMSPLPEGHRCRSGEPEHATVEDLCFEFVLWKMLLHSVS